MFHHLSFSSRVFFFSFVFAACLLLGGNKVAARTTNGILALAVDLCESSSMSMCVCERVCACPNCTRFMASLHIQKGSARSAFL